MQIVLNNEYSVQQQDIGYALVKTYLTRGNADNKTAKPRVATKPIAYHMTIAGCVKSFVDKYVDDKSEDYIGELKGYVERLENITSACKEEVIKGVEKIL